MCNILHFITTNKIMNLLRQTLKSQQYRLLLLDNPIYKNDLRFFSISCY